MFDGVSNVEGRPSKMIMTTKRLSPPVMSCQAVVASGGAGCPPFLGKHDPTGHGQSAAEGSQDTNGIQAGLGLKCYQANPKHSGEAGHHDAGCQAFVQEPAGQQRDNERLDAADDRRDTARQPVGRDEEQRKKRPDVQHPEDPGLPPPGTTWHPAADHQEQQSGRQRTQCPRKQRATLGQEHGGREIGGAPQHWSKGGGQDQESSTAKHLAILAKYLAKA